MLVNAATTVPKPTRQQGFDKYGIGHFECVKTDKLRATLGFPGGMITSGNSLGWVKEDMDIMTEHEAVAKEMEVC